MDEAERCHRLAILNRGRLVADGSPAELTGALAGRVVAVSTPDAREAQRILAGRPGILSVAQIGNDLRVLTARGEDFARRVQADLRAAGLDAQAAAVPANLEDVFVEATGAEATQAKAEAAA
jgi:ABC-2 type transport system ATP-binding protein